MKVKDLKKKLAEISDNLEFCAHDRAGPLEKELFKELRSTDEGYDIFIEMQNLKQTILDIDRDVLDLIKEILDKENK